jgi:Fur family zinc uptake transcriptional regulator
MALGDLMQLTENQRHVLAALQKAESPMTAYALLDALRGKGFTAPTQVYRALERLASYGMVHRLETLNAYVSCAHQTDCHPAITAFAICDNCGHVDEFSDDDLSHSLGRWMKRNAFSLRTSTIELHGRCSTCGG